MGEKKSMFTGMGLGVIVGVVVFICVWCFGDVLTSVFTTDTAVIQKGTEYLRGFAPETIVTAVLFSMVGFFNGYEKTVWVMIQGLVQTLLIRLPLAYVMSIQPHASLLHKNRTGSAGCHLFWNRVECHFLFDFFTRKMEWERKKKNCCKIKKQNNYNWRKNTKNDILPLIFCKMVLSHTKFIQLILQINPSAAIYNMI